MCRHIVMGLHAGIIKGERLRFHPGQCIKGFRASHRQFCFVRTWKNSCRQAACVPSTRVCPPRGVSNAFRATLRLTHSGSKRVCIFPWGSTLWSHQRIQSSASVRRAWGNNYQQAEYVYRPADPRVGYIKGYGMQTHALAEQYGMQS